MSSEPKYRIKKFVNPETRDLILSSLGIDKATFYRKIGVLMSEKGGFEYTEMLKIAEILEREPKELLSDEAFKQFEEEKDSE